MREIDIKSFVQFVIIDPSTVVPILLFFYRSPSCFEIPLFPCRSPFRPPCRSPFRPPYRSPFRPP